MSEEDDDRPVRTGTTVEEEIAAIRAAVLALESIDAEARRRVLAYLAARYGR